ncbi:cobalamin-binding protein [Allohahella marinimesophila]|uniref:Cobalamin-binding protein n=1 Tax=Allohahella marinimesophila TaxID=1054972 RepID=A0ABP7P0V0_9GAMM
MLAAERCAVDDMDRKVCIEAPAARIATLSPGATELVYAAGAGEKVVAVVSHSDYPPAAKQVQSVGSHTRLDLEALVALKPDLLIGWTTGNPSEQVDKLEALGLTLFFIEPRDFEGVATAIERLALLFGTASEGDAVAAHFREGIAELARRYKDVAPVEVFYQVWDEPLMTVNDEHLIGKVLTLCGGRNVFGGLDRLVPRIDIEAVLASNPEVIIAGGMGEENPQWLTPWGTYEHLKAVKQDNLFFVPPSLIQRPTPRLLEGSQVVCEKLEQARARR